MHIAANGGHSSCLIELAERDRDLVHLLDANGNSALHYAASNGFTGVSLHSLPCQPNADCVDVLVRSGVHVDVKDAQGRTPLLYAAFHGQTSTVRLLSELGAAISSQDQKGNSPLHIAARNGHAEVIEFLLQQGADGENTCHPCKSSLRQPRSRTRMALPLQRLPTSASTVQVAPPYLRPIRSQRRFLWNSQRAL